MPDGLEESYSNGAGDSPRQGRRYYLCYIFVRLGVHAAGETSVQFAECTISHLLAVSHLAFCWGYFYCSKKHLIFTRCSFISIPRGCFKHIHFSLSRFKPISNPFIPPSLATNLKLEWMKRWWGQPVPPWGYQSCVTAAIIWVSHCIHFQFAVFWLLLEESVKGNYEQHKPITK